ncbi:MAG: acyl-CoA dehydrogenase family protein [Proteobacteria bacterium]|nr:acyl-CoA dehydrogenase family protein [Pseudomonadota bacterium]
MVTCMDEALENLRNRCARFARDHMAGRGLSASDEFPRDIWRDMGRAGLLGLGIPEEHGGRGGGYPHLSAAGEALVRHGGNLGLPMSAILHQLVAHFLIAGHGSETQQQAFLPDMAEGRITGCLAISEPRTGAHPRHMKTEARLQDDAYLVSGEKTFLTNGPIADLYVVMAVTGQDADGRNRISAFILPRQTPGLTLADPLPLDFLKPSPHGGIRLDGARVPADRMLGPANRAYETFIKPFREIEDAVMLGPWAGGMSRQMELLADAVRQSGTRTETELLEDWAS